MANVYFMNPPLPINASVSFTGASIIAYSDMPSFNFGTRAAGSSNDKIISMTNLSSTETAFLNTPTLTGTGFTFKGGMFPGTGGTCTNSLGPSQNCMMVVNFMPPSNLSYNATLSSTHSYSGGSGLVVDLALAGTGTYNAELSITDYPPEYYAFYGVPSDPATFNFGNIGVTNQVKHSFRVSNQGGSNAFGLNFATLADPYSVTYSNCPTMLAQGQGCDVEVTLNSSSFGTKPDTLIANYSGGVSSTATRPITAQIQMGAILTLYDHYSDSTGGISLSTNVDYGTIGVSPMHDEKEIAVYNSGNSSATAVIASFSDPAFTFVGGSYPGGTPGAQGKEDLKICGSTINPGTACSIRVSFSAASPGLNVGTLTLTYSGGSVGPATRGFKGTTITSSLLTVSEFNGGGDGGLIADFGLAPMSQDSDKYFLLRNIGGSSANSVNSPGISGDPAFAYPMGFPGGPAGSNVNMNGQNVTVCTPYGTLMPGDTCLFHAVFHPTSSVQTGATMTFNWNAGSIQKSVVGTGTNQAIVEIKDYLSGGGGHDPYDFGPSGIQTSHVFIISNYGSSGAWLNSASLSGAAQFHFANGGMFPGGTGSESVPNNGGSQTLPYCGATPFLLSSNSQCVVKINFDPAGSTQVSGALDINLSGATAATASRSFKGLQVSGPMLVLADPNNGGGSGTGDLGFGLVANNQTNTRQIKVTNVGSGMATGMGDGGINPADLIFTYFNGSYPGTSTTENMNGTNYPPCGNSLSSGASCAMVIGFTPSNAIDYSATLSLISSAPTATANLHGTGTMLANIYMYPYAAGGGGSFNFGTWGVAKTQFFVLQNSGMSSANVTIPSISGGSDFQFPGGYPGNGGGVPNTTGQPYCTYTLGAYSSCVIAVQFNPFGDGMRNASLSIGLSGATSSSANLSLQGNATSQAMLMITEDADIYGRTSPNAPPASMGNGANYASAHTTLRLINIGGGTAFSLSAAPFVTTDQDNPGYVVYSFSGGSYPGTGGTCMPTLSPGAICTVVIDLSPPSFIPNGRQYDDTFRMYFSGGTAYRDIRGFGYY